MPKFVYNNTINMNQTKIFLPVKMFFQLLIIPFIFIGTVDIHSQNNTVAGGGEATGAGGTVSYSIGQIDYINSTSGSGTITQGVQQPYEFFTMGGIEEPWINLLVSVYPNPSSNIIMLSLSSDDFSNMSYALYNMEGKLLVQQVIMNQQTSISLFEQATGTYLLKVLINNNAIKTFKIIKNQ